MLLKPTLINNDILVSISIVSSSSNTIISVSTLKNQVLFGGSCGLLNIKGTKKSTFYASQKIAIILGKKICYLGFKYAYINIKGFGNGRYSSIKGFNSTGLVILNIFDKTTVSFNGCKVPKRRRL